VDTRHRDSRHWSQRWMRVAIVESDAVVLYDLHQPVEIRSCGGGRCHGVNRQAATPGRRYRVCRFFEVDVCPRCGQMSGATAGHRSLYYGDSQEDAQMTYARAEALLMGRDVEDAA
jgi:hypothetical protein